MLAARRARAQETWSPRRADAQARGGGSGSWPPQDCQQKDKEGRQGRRSPCSAAAGAVVRRWSPHLWSTVESGLGGACDGVCRGVGAVDRGQPSSRPPPARAACLFAFGFDRRSGGGETSRHRILLKANRGKKSCVDVSNGCNNGTADPRRFNSDPTCTDDTTHNTKRRRRAGRRAQDQCSASSRWAAVGASSSATTYNDAHNMCRARTTGQGLTA